MDVSGKFQEIGVFFTKNGLVPPLKEVAPGPIFQIVMAGISKLQALHDFRKRGLLDFDQKMNMLCKALDYVKLRVWTSAYPLIFCPPA